MAPCRLPLTAALLPPALDCHLWFSISVQKKTPILSPISQCIQQKLNPKIACLHFFSFHYVPWLSSFTMHWFNASIHLYCMPHCEWTLKSHPHWDPCPPRLSSAMLLTAAIHCICCWESCIVVNCLNGICLFPQPQAASPLAFQIFIFFRNYSYWSSRVW